MLESPPPVSPDGTAPAKAAPPNSFAAYLRAMGPGIVVVLTWLGAGDLVDASVAGGAYGYALMWVLALALVIRWLFVSAIARYQLCNPHGESVMQGFHRLHPLLPLGIAVATLLLSHVIGVYMYKGLGESLRALTGGGHDLFWGLLWAVAFHLLLHRGEYRRVEIAFLIFLGLLSASLLGASLWSGPDLGAIVSGTVGFRLPETRGSFDPMLVAVSLMGAVAGSLANLMYPYFIREKGWTSPAHRTVQRYDLALGIVVLIILDLSVWVLGAEVLHSRGLQVENLADLAEVLARTLGPLGAHLFYLGVFSAVASSIVGNALGYSSIATDAFLVWSRKLRGTSDSGYRTHPGFRAMVLWCLFSPLVWLGTGQGNFVPLTVAVNAIQVLILPVLAISMWLLTANPRYIGPKHRNSPAENLAMALFTTLAILGAYGVLKSFLK